MFAHVGTTAKLHCPVNPGLCGKLHSVKWYKDTSRIYVLSHSGMVKRPEGTDATDRYVYSNFLENRSVILIKSSL